MAHNDGDQALDAPTFEHIITRQQTARFEYKCDVCGRKILIGQVYWRIIGKVDGEFTSIICCSPGGHCALEN